MLCRHCHKPVSEIIDPNGVSHGWIHYAEDGPDAYVYCGDEYGTDADGDYCRWCGLVHDGGPENCVT